MVVRRLTGAGLLTYGSAVLGASAQLAWRKRDPGLLAAHPGQLIIADKGYVSAELDRWLADLLIGCSFRPLLAKRGEGRGE